MPVDLPTGKRPGWELDAAEDEEERASVLDSCVVLQSLRQSRDQWMYFAFPRFSGRVRGKPDAVPPPHTIQFRGRCQIEIGPHIFEETSFYEVQYLAPAPAPSFIQSPWQSSPYGYTPYGQQNAQAAIQTPVAQHAASPLLSSLSSMTSISPALINQVNAAAASNPTLANLLQLAAAGKGTPEQLKTLGLLIQSLATTESSESLSSAANLAQSSTQPYTPPAPATTSVKEFDLVFQYHETSHERWILPRGAVICEKVADPRTPSLTYDIVLTMALQLPKAVQPSTEAVEADPQVVTIRLKRPQPAIWEMIWKWVGGEEKLNENRKTLDKLKKQTERVYLAHRIPENSLLTQLRNATASTYVMKSIKPGPVVAPRPKRQRKPPQPTSQPQPQASGSAPQAQGAAAATTTSLTVTTAPQAAWSSGRPEPKRAKVSKPKASPAVEIRCVSCHQTDVPLILGGRFCRPCVDSGKATTVYVPYRPPQNSYQAQHNMPVAPVYAQNMSVAPVYAQASRPSGSLAPTPNAVPPPG